MKRALPTRILRHLRANAVAYLALFVALGGSSYAATSVPAGSVGARQIGNYSITPIKFNPARIGGYVRAWATVSADGRVLSSSGRVKIGPVFAGDEYNLTWRVGFPHWCAATANITGLQAGFATVDNTGLGGVTLSTYNAQGQPMAEAFDVVVTC